jgi:hypothetical protein
MAQDIPPLAFSQVLIVRDNYGSSPEKFAIFRRVTKLGIVRAGNAVV